MWWCHLFDYSTVSEVFRLVWWGRLFDYSTVSEGFRLVWWLYNRCILQLQVTGFNYLFAHGYFVSSIIIWYKYFSKRKVFIHRYGHKRNYLFWLIRVDLESMRGNSTLWWCSRNARDLGNAEYHFIAITPWSTLARRVSTSLGSLGQIVLNCVFMLNWIAWNRTVFLC